MSASCHKWAVIAIQFRHGERQPGGQIVSRHKTREAAERNLPSGSGWGGSGVDYYIRRLYRWERGLGMA